MATLLELLRQPTAAPAAPTPLGQTQAVSRLLRAKTGSVTGSAAPAAEAVDLAEGEQLQTGQIQQQLQERSQLLKQAELGQKQQLLNEQQQLSDKQSQQQRQFIASDAARKTDRLVQDFRANANKIDADTYRNKMEQLAFNIRLQNDQYISALEDAGARARLDDETEFKKQMAANIFADSLDLLKNKQYADALMNADNREFARLLSTMSIDDAVKLADMQSSAASRQSLISGVAQLPGVAAQGYTNIHNAQRDAKREEREDATAAASVPTTSAAGR